MLVAYVGHESRLSRRTKDGLTERDHLLAAERMTRKARPELVGPTMPDWLSYLWEWFKELQSGRQSGFGVQPFAWTEMHAWAQMTSRRPTPWEVHCLRSMDRAWLSPPEPPEQEES